MEDWSTWDDDRVFKNASEQPGSQASYWRETEIKRRLYLLQRQAVQAQLAATAAQADATTAQREAIAEMKRQSNMMLWSVIGVFLTALVTLAAAFIHG
jgi:hypothetical protein